jgi:HEPN domain-containing protein
LFVILRNNQLVLSFPPVRIDFDATNIPASVVTAFEEAITCHANNCFVASAIMVRKTLEELCRDRQAQGKDLRERIRDLGTKIVLPQELLNGLDDLRLLGNDAAHIESREYEKIGKEEVEIGIEFAKEVLKATYQYSALLARLKSLQKQA